MRLMQVVVSALFAYSVLANAVAAPTPNGPAPPLIELHLQAEDSIDAQYTLAMKYLKGEGVARDLAVALQWLREAAGGGHVDAEYQLGLLYRDGIGVPKDLTRAMRWLQVAGVAGHEKAQTAYAELHRAQLLRESGNLRAAAKGGDATAQYTLGQHYLVGKAPLVVNPAQAVVWLTRAAERQHADAQYEIGTFYRDGTHVARDPVLARKWLAKAAAQGHVKAKVAVQDIIRAEAGAAGGPEKNFKSSQSLPVYRAAVNGDVNAQFELGLLFIRGEAVQKDFTRGVEWVQHAAERNHVGAQLQLADMYLRGMELQQDAAEAFKWYLRAAQQGDVQAQYMLGNLYRAGSGVAENPGEARRWYAAAAKQGHVKAKERLAPEGQ